MARIQIAEHVWAEDPGFGLYAETYNDYPSYEQFAAVGQFSVQAATNPEVQPQQTEQPRTEVAP